MKQHINMIRGIQDLGAHLAHILLGLIGRVAQHPRPQGQRERLDGVIKRDFAYAADVFETGVFGP